MQRDSSGRPQEFYSNDWSVEQWSLLSGLNLHLIRSRNLAEQLRIVHYLLIEQWMIFVPLIEASRSQPVIGSVKAFHHRNRPVCIQVNQKNYPDLQWI